MDQLINLGFGILMVLILIGFGLSSVLKGFSIGSLIGLLMALGGFTLVIYRKEISSTLYPYFTHMPYTFVILATLLLVFVVVFYVGMEKRKS